MNVWLTSALALLVAMLPLGIAALRRPAIEGLPSLQVAGVNTALILVLLSIGLGRQPFVQLALVGGLLAFAGTLAFAAVLERR